jgi:hypothetical protein
MEYILQRGYSNTMLFIIVITLNSSDFIFIILCFIDSGQQSLYDFFQTNNFRESVKGMN